ncbi:IS21-like element helper ATPase IstB [Nocardioides sp.]|uniref:IS21-like element helper ATPase IstB n=1 Tax=Nocardioides sp. TaxID=35761 RepID=UPI003D0C5BF0
MKEAILPLLLKELRLPSIGQFWESFQRQATSENWTYGRYLAHLCEQELSERHTRRLSRHMNQSRLPRGKSLESFNFSSCGLNRAEVIALASEDSWVRSGKNVLIFGPSGVGKTHLAAAIGEQLVQQGVRVLFTRTTELVQGLQQAKRELTLSATLDKLDKYDCIILDDFGYVKKSEQETTVLFELICERYERRSLMLTCNQSFKDWDSIFSDKMMAVAAVDRLVHHALILEVRGESYRRKAALERGGEPSAPGAGPYVASGESGRAARPSDFEKSSNSKKEEQVE